MGKSKREIILFAGIVAIYLGVTLYQLRQLPGEWYGDITIEHNQVMSILAGNWPWKFDTSAGPAYHYIVAGFAYFLGPTYETYKLASLITGLITVFLMYLLGKELGGGRVGLFTAVTGAVSFWLILFARLGSSPQILSPLLACAAVYFLLRFHRTLRWYDASLSMFFAGWGFFNYPATFVLPAGILVLMVWQVIFSRQRVLWLRALAIAAITLLPFLAIFGLMVVNSPDMLQGGYVGSKIMDPNSSLLKVGQTFAKNMVIALGMFQWTGDNAFRTNLSGKPMLDLVSGVLMLVGLVWLFVEPSLRRNWMYVIVPIVIFIMPSAAPGIPTAEIPSASRALGVAPFVFLLVGLGIEAIWCGIARLGSLLHMSTWTVATCSVAAVLIIAVIGYLNVTKYFEDYAWGLPAHNQPWGWQIAQYLDTYPANVQVKLASCCWGDWSQPEPSGILNTMQHPHGREEITSWKPLNSCSQLTPNTPYVIIFAPEGQEDVIDQFRSCFPGSQGELHYDGMGQPSFYSLVIK